MIFVEKVDVIKGDRILETYGDLLVSPRIRYWENKGCEVIITWIGDENDKICK